MSARYLGFILLVGFPGMLHAQSAAQPCRAPRLVGGYFVPDQQTYAHETKLTYACDEGLKPAVEGWWATSTCQNGKWSPQPQCIDENACLPPAIPNAKYTENTNGWYEQGAKLRTTCDTGYEHKDWDATAECINGTWLSLPICEKSISTCSEPPKVPHAVITNMGYQDVFVVDSKVQYLCEDGYTTDGTHTNKSVFCLRGHWAEVPTCSPRSDTGHGGSPVGGTGGSGTQPVDGGSSSSSGSDEREITHITPIINCGRRPVISNGDVVDTGEMFLKYRCNSFYTRVGPDTVVCYSNGKWSEVPTCKVAYCSVDTDRYRDLESVGVKYIKDGEKVNLKCEDLESWWTGHYSVARCTNGRITFSRCCSWVTIKLNRC
ncbi:complement factor H-like [Toxotes jaculatrix]|uniref:complement factor H-like n=1 Tax=Toxotes jaculatrix TaxID=941984 RepID=UPI001B3B1BAC|nr:complement factor H-like [Toxotes jaculatrix]